MKRQRQISVQCSIADDFVDKMKSPQKRRQSNRRKKQNQSTDIVIPNVQRNNEDIVENPKRKTPVKNRKPLLTIKCSKITDYFQLTEKLPEVPEPPLVPESPHAEIIVLVSSEDEKEREQKLNIVNSPKNPPKKSTTNPNTKMSNCPDYKIVEGTNFAVDAFRFGELSGITTYFLTHFHSDHYVGLNGKFTKPIYMSTITGRLVATNLKVNSKWIKTVNINTTYIIDGVEVTPIDANHCPGAVMFIFKLPCGRIILHTGDFRATPEMESNPVFWNNNISLIYLDTTYLHKSYDFCSQSEALSFVEDEVIKFIFKNIGINSAIVVGSYLIGKERVWAHIAQKFEMKVWLDGERRKAFDLIYSDENENQFIKNFICDVREDAQLHVIPIHCINYRFLDDYRSSLGVDNLLAFKPTGWARNVKPQYSSKVSIVGVQYSEHSSYNELKRFVRFIRPEKVISTVPKSSKSNKTQTIPTDWLTDSTRPQTSQRTVTSFLKVKKNVSSLDKSNDCQSECTSSLLVPLVSDDGSYETDFMP